MVPGSTHCVTCITARQKPFRHYQPIQPAHSAGREVVIFLMAGAAESPHTFAYFWAWKWFRMFWRIALAMTIVGLLCPAT
jgi:hypothetical protein